MGDYKTINIRNKRATFDYEILEEFVAGWDSGCPSSA